MWRPRLLRVALLLLFVAGLAAGWLGRPGHGGPGPLANAQAAWLAAPAEPPVVTTITPDAPPTTATTAPPAPTPPRPVDRPSRSAVAPPPAAAPQTTQDKIAAAMARITYPWQQTGYRIVFSGSQPGMQGRTSPRSMGFIEIYVRPDETVDNLAHVIAHEIGHAVDLTYGNDQRRSVWLQLRGITPRPWFTCSMCDDFSVPAGDFAETFAYWQVGDFSRSRLAPPPTPAQLAQLVPLFGPT